MTLRKLLVLSSMSLAACGLGPFAEPGGGGENLPQSGAGPYLFPAPDFDTPVDEPYLLAQPVVSLTDPSVRILSSGDYEIYYTRNTDEGSEIWRLRLESLTSLPLTPPELVLAPSEAWEGTGLRAPSIVAGESEVFLYYEGGDETFAIGLARSADDGQTFVKHGSSPLIEDAAGPDVIAVDDYWLMVHADPEGSQIFLREGSDVDSFGEPRSVASARLGVQGAIDSLGIGAPALRRQISSAGREHYGLFYAGLGANSEGEAVSSIGYYGSFDLLAWTAFLGGGPILDAEPSGAGGPAPVLSGTNSLLFVHQARQGRGRIAVAIGP
tara:strand:+ start:22461 stop:23435 length:975 start_codon:yes stop_codon:yes gene_type:complete